jgi:hypothetical protein
LRLIPTVAIAAINSDLGEDHQLNADGLTVEAPGAMFT